MGTLQEFQLIPKTKFKCGQAVCLRTGGPGMTVREITKQPKGPWVITCDWFVEGEADQKTFYSDQLVPWEGEDEEESESVGE